MFSRAFQYHYTTPKSGYPGEVTVNSSDPLVQPNINLNFFADDLDIIPMREDLKVAVGQKGANMIKAEYKVY
ncbi:hypothetical protein CDV31_002684 [Fusarium ambrosium]|uniref:Uncharacterized protein n=1 Tax=Fusarium ambrosium TaxID=131363 RepID=A0A428UW77_9HYPO|nr:hypothetical protein CDV31_002684 [Fusarium ambrosium]